MAWDHASFKARWTEFAPCPDSLVDAAIAEATEEVDARVYGAKADAAVGLLAAHKLSISPQGQQARLDPKAFGDGEHGTTTYGIEFDTITRNAGGGVWAMGVSP